MSLTPVADLFPDGDFPAGECVAYRSDAWRKSDSEKIALERTAQNTADLKDIRQAAQVHRTVRGLLRSALRPGMSTTEAANLVEKNVRHLVKANGLQAGCAFPTGLSINHCAAHYSPNQGDRVTIGYDDVLKVDFGVHVNGRIVDCAFTHCFNDRYRPLLAAVREATDAGIREAGIDARISEISTVIQETMEAYEVTLDGRTLPVRPIRNLNGHSIDRYRIHSEKIVPIVGGVSSASDKMAEGEFYAIETFGSTGRGYVVEQGECSHYMRNYTNSPAVSSCRLAPKTAALLQRIEHNFSTLAFCRRWLDSLGERSYALPLSQLVDKGLINDYPPLCDVAGSYTAQFEHTIYLRPTCKEVVTRGTDY